MKFLYKERLMNKEQIDRIMAGQAKIISLLQQIIVLLFIFAGVIIGILIEANPALILAGIGVVVLVYLVQRIAQASVKIGQKSYCDLEKKILSDFNEAREQGRDESDN